MKHYEVVCALIYNNEGKVYCCKRGKGRALEGKWEFPGGKVEDKESYEETIVREIKEELDSIIKPIEFIGKSYYEYKDIKPYDEFSITLYAYKCILISGDLKISEHSDSKWLSFDEMHNYDFAKADIPFIK